MSGECPVCNEHTLECTCDHSQVFNCSQCHKEVNPLVQPSTQCNLCRKEFCCALYMTCFSDHRYTDKCYGNHQTILSPEWKMNLRSK